MYWSISFTFYLLDAMIFFNRNFSKGWVSTIYEVDFMFGDNRSPPRILLVDKSPEFLSYKYYFSRLENLFKYDYLPC